MFSLVLKHVLERTLLIWGSLPFVLDQHGLVLPSALLASKRCPAGAELAAVVAVAFRKLENDGVDFFLRLTWSGRWSPSQRIVGCSNKLTSELGCESSFLEHALRYFMLRLVRSHSGSNGIATVVSCLYLTRR